MKLAVCGSREITIEFHELDKLIDALRLHAVEIVSGGANGIDAVAEEFAYQFEIKYTEFPADWESHGKAAGPIRNRQIAQYADQLLVIRYPDSKGSISVASEFRKLGKPVTEIILTRNDEV